MFLLEPFAMLFDPSKRVFWPFILGALLMGGLVGLATKQTTLRNIFRFLFPRKIWLHRSARLDYKLLFAKAILRALWLVPWTLSAFGIAVWIVTTLDRHFGTPTITSMSSTTVTILYTAVLFVTWDLSRYVFHRLLHAVPLLWEFHKVHHSAEVLTPFTLYRTHPVESVLYNVRGILVTATVTGLFFYLFRQQAVAYQFLGVNAAGFLFNLVGGNLRHSHIWLSYGSRLSHYLISPAQHQIHHSRDPDHWGKNFGSWLALWDRLAGTLYVPIKQPSLAFGLDDHIRNHRSDSAISAIWGPIYSSIRSARTRRSALVATVIFVVIASISIAHAQNDAGVPPTDGRDAGQSDQSESAPEQPPAPSQPDAATKDQTNSKGTAEEGDDDIVILDENGDTESTRDTSQDAPVTAKPAETPSDNQSVKPDTKPAAKDIDLILDTISIFGNRKARERASGSAHKIGSKQLEQYEYDDIHRVLTPVPGVYVRGEDGYGLRPNIGLRGANSDRSAKVTLMEDGILLGPAPYSAPAAYYFPLMSRMIGLEVFKGPASIRYGPNTIGGALNLQTRAIPRVASSGLDLSLGQDRFGKLHGYLGTSGKRWGVLFEGMHLQTDGFKDLDGGGDTGFDKSEFMLRSRYHTNPAGKLYHQFDIKLGYAEETSNETYLGLSDADFRATPQRRYVASSAGLMDWDRTQLQLGYYLAKGERFDLQATAYRHDFSRDWTKLNQFRDGPELRSILANPDEGQAAILFEILTGAQDSTNANQALLIGTNSRKFVSQGLSLVSHFRPPKLGPVSQEIEVGARLHYDRVSRNHTEDGFLMLRQTLVPDGSAQQTTTRNRGKTTAWALYAQDQIEVNNFLFSPGLRLEIISSDFIDRLSNETSSNTDVVLIPGIGAHYQVLPWLGLLAGVHRGFSPVVPQADDPDRTEDPRHEASINYEAGIRANWPHSQAELVGFFNDYSNLTSHCPQSGGCTDSQIDRQFDAGGVHVYGLEALLAHKQKLPFDLSLSGQVSYTLTLSEFLTDFSSANPQFGEVEKGDELAYVPNHQLNISADITWQQFSLQGSATYVGEMRDVAGQGSIDESERIDSHFVVDLAGQYQASKRSQVYLKVDNLLDQDYVISKRPFGARPGRPFQLTIGFKFNTGS